MDTRLAGSSSTESEAKQVSPLVASLREHLKKWYETPREKRTEEMSNVYEGVEVSG